MTDEPDGDLTVAVKLLDHAASEPVYASAGAAGADLTAAIAEGEVLQLRPGGGRALVPTGIAIALPEGAEAQIRPRSGLAAKHGVTVLNAPGTIDWDYRGEIFVPLINHGDEPFTLRRGDRIAQMVIAPVMRARFAQARMLTETARGVGGFGSTGVSGAPAQQKERGE